jgi:hypothetical protein
MRRSAIGAILFAILVLGALGAVGYGVYQIGYEQGLVASGAEVVGPLVGYYPGLLGFGIFGLFFKIFFLFLVLALIGRFFFGRRRWRGGPPWAKEWHEGGTSPMDQRLAEWHRRAHTDGPPEGSTSEPTT